MNLEKWTNSTGDKELVIDFDACTLKLNRVVTTKKLEISIKDILDETEDAVKNGLISLTLCDLRAIAWYEGLRPVEYNLGEAKIPAEIKDWTNKCWDKCKFKNDYFSHMEKVNKEEEIKKAKEKDLIHCSISSSACTETVIGQLHEGVELITPEN